MKPSHFTKFIPFVFLVVAACGSEEPVAGQPTEQPEPADPVVTPAPEPEPDPGSAVARFRDVDDGFSVFEGNLDGTDYLVARFSPQNFSIDIFADQGKASSGRATSYLVKSEGATAVLSGGFLASFSPAVPMGLVVLDGTIANRPHDIGLLNGVIETRQMGVNVRLLTRPLIESRQPPDFDILQSGPMIVDDGQSVLDLANEQELGRLERDEFERAFFCVDRQGNALLVATGPTYLRDLANRIGQPVSAGGLGCRAAINLSGANSRSLVVEGGRQRFEMGDTLFRNATAIVVTKRNSR